MISSGSVAVAALGVLAAPGCGRSIVPYEQDSDDSSDSTETDPTDPSGNPTSVTVTDPTEPSGNPTSDPTSVSVTVTDPTDPTGPQPHDGPPQLVAGYFVDAARVELVFSEPIASLGAIDTGKFRLSAASHGSYYGSGTLYADLGVWNGEEICNEYCYEDDYGGDDYGETDGECYEWCYTMPGPNVHVATVTNSSAYTERVVLQLDQLINANVCETLRERIEQGADAAAIFLHYSNNGPGIADTDNEQLEAIAEHWVLLQSQNYSYQPDFFPYMIPFVPIDCPF
jgi:hypothetical protein